jgi:phospholipid transport system substrate-binding protein
MFIMRRLLSLVAAVVVTLAVASVAAHAAATPEATIRSFYATLLQTMKQGPALGEKGRYSRLAPVIRSSFDLRAMAHMAVGLSWARFSPTQREQVTDAFARYTIATYADNFSSYAGESFVVTRARQTPYGTIVDSRIVKSNGEPVSIDYLMHQNGDDWHVADVYLTGTVSQVATLRAQFTAVLAEQGVQGLVATLNHKAEMLVASSSPS